MIQFVLLCGILNLLLGYGLAVALADHAWIKDLRWKEWAMRLPRIRPGAPANPRGHDTEVLVEPPEEDAPAVEVASLAAAVSTLAAQQQPEHDPGPMLPPVAPTSELPAAWREQLEGDLWQPPGFADSIAQGLRLELAGYRQHVLAAEARARLALARENGAELEQLVADFRFLHHEWLARLSEGAELLRARHGRLGDAEESGRRLESLLFDHAARMEAIDRRIGEIQFKTDIVFGCRRLLSELFELAAAVHRLRDDLGGSLAEILAQWQTLGQLPHDQRLDPLTGRGTRLGLEAEAADPSGSTPRTRQAVLIALDRFGRINERLGTRAGDRVLRAFNQLLADLLEQARSSAEISRVGGTRFLLLVDLASRDQAVSLAEQLRQSLEAVTWDNDGASLELSASFGLTTHPVHEPLATLLARLDAAVEAARLAGGNRCAVADESGAKAVVPQMAAVISRRVAVGDPSDLAPRIEELPVGDGAAAESGQSPSPS